MVAIEGRYVGDLRCEATHGPSGSTLATDAPVDNMGKGEAFSPTDLVATALGTCIVTIIAIVAERHGLDVSGATFRVEKHMATDPVRRIGRLPVTIRLPASISAEGRTMLERAAHTCPVHKSLHPDVEAKITFLYE
jgi:putative redox protein